jgi:phage-related baseplate assembly protein
MNYFVGRLVRTIGGEQDQDGEGNERDTPPGAIGFLADENLPGQWAAHFGDAAVFLEESELSDPKQYQLITRSSEIGMAPEQEQEVRRRVESVGELLSLAGPAYTFWKHAVDALRADAQGGYGADWSAVHLLTIRESMGEMLQPQQDVLEALLKYSPGAVADVQVQATQEQVRNFADELVLSANAASTPSLG